MTNGLCNTISISIMRTKQSSIPVSIVIESLPGKEPSELICNFAKSFLMKFILNAKLSLNPSKALAEG